MSPLLRIARALGAFRFVVNARTLGYAVLGFGILNALYQTITTIKRSAFVRLTPRGGSARSSRFCSYRPEPIRRCTPSG
jgi:voltage-gated potassium channel